MEHTCSVYRSAVSMFARLRRINCCFQIRSLLLSSAPAHRPALNMYLRATRLTTPLPTTMNAAAAGGAAIGALDIRKRKVAHSDKHYNNYYQHNFRPSPSIL